MHWDTLKQDNKSTVGGDGRCRVGEVRAGTTSPMPDHKGFQLQYLSEIHPLHFYVNFQKLSMQQGYQHECKVMVLLTVHVVNSQPMTAQRGMMSEHKISLEGCITAQM